MKDQLTYLAYATGWALVRRLPEPVAHWLFRLLADIAHTLRRPSVQRLEANLRRVSPAAGTKRVREMSRAGMRSYLHYWCDMFRLPDWDHLRVVDSVETHREHLLKDPLAAGGGVVGALAHMGNWDHAGAWACATGAPVTTVAERVRPERLYDRFVAFRAGLGMEILPLTGGGGDAPSTLVTLAERLRGPAFVPLLADRDLTATGVEVDFFGERTRFPPGPALLALRTGAPLMPLTLHNEGRTLHLTMHPYIKVPADGTTREKVAAMMQDVAHVFEGAIREHPADWHMLQRLWLSDLEPSAPDPVSNPGGDPSPPRR